jgi:hypothetical protein
MIPAPRSLATFRTRRGVYFGSYAMRPYLPVALLFRYPGTGDQADTHLAKAGRPGGVRFPAGIATHSTEQVFYFDDRDLLHCENYGLVVSGGALGAIPSRDMREFSGGHGPDQTQALFPRQPDRTSLPEPLLVSIGLVTN